MEYSSKLLILYRATYLIFITRSCRLVKTIKQMWDSQFDLHISMPRSVNWATLWWAAMDLHEWRLQPDTVDGPRWGGRGGHQLPGDACGHVCVCVCPCMSVCLSVSCSRALNTQDQKTHTGDEGPNATQRWKIQDLENEAPCRKRVYR